MGEGVWGRCWCSCWVVGVCVGCGCLCGVGVGVGVVCVCVLGVWCLRCVRVAWVPVQVFCVLHVEQHGGDELVHALGLPDDGLELVIHCLPHHPLQPLHPSHPDPAPTHTHTHTPSKPAQHTPPPLHTHTYLKAHTSTIADTTVREDEQRTE